MNWYPEGDCKIVLGTRERLKAVTSSFIRCAAQAGFVVPPPARQTSSLQLVCVYELSLHHLGWGDRHHRVSPPEPVQHPPANAARLEQSQERASTSDGL